MTGHENVPAPAAVWAGMSDAERDQLRRVAPALAAALTGQPATSVSYTAPLQSGPVATIRLAGGEPLPVTSWEIHRDVDMVRSLYASLPDRAWSYTDEHGHEHRWLLPAQATTAALRKADQDEALPTLVRTYEHHGCGGDPCDDEDCEGYTVTVWRCRECRDVVEPGREPDTEAMDVGLPIYGPTEWTCTVDASGHDRSAVWDLESRRVPFDAEALARRARRGGAEE